MRKGLLQEDVRSLYLVAAKRIWWWHCLLLNSLVRRLAERTQNHSTFFFRNRPELELMGRLLGQASHGSNLAISVLGCSAGAEVYSIAWTIRSARPDLKLTLHAVDIAHDVIEFAQEGVYSLKSTHADVEGNQFTWNTHRDQTVSIFERMTEYEMNAMFDRGGDLLKVKPWLKEGIVWHCANAEDPELLSALGPQDAVVANRFLCHMKPAAAERCLRSIAALVKPSGYLFASGVDLDVRTRVARQMGWHPVPDLLREVHEGDPSLRNGWPLEYWALEPFQSTRRDRLIRYAAAFRLAMDTFLALGLPEHAGSIMG